MKPPKIILFATFGLCLIGLIFLSYSSLNESLTTTGDPYYFLKKQLIWLVIGTFGFFFGKFINLNLLKQKSFYLYVAAVILLLIVLIPGLGNQALGARRWLNTGFVDIQPSEIAKLFCLIFFSAYFSQGDKVGLKQLLIFLGIPLGLIILEPNLSTAILLAAMTLCLFYLAGGEIMTLVSISSLAIIAAFLLTIISPYRHARLESLLHQDTATESSSYHTNQLVLSLASGGLTGKGFANSIQKYSFLPKISTDSIFAIIGEEIGFIGALLIIAIYLLMITSIFKLSQMVSDPFLSLLIAGVGLLICFQTLINIAAVVALIPLTGVPLPFISYGGSSLVSLLFAIGLTQNRRILSSLVYSNKDETEKGSGSHRYPSHTGYRNHQRAAHRQQY